MEKIPPKNRDEWRGLVMGEITPSIQNYVLQMKLAQARKKVEMGETTLPQAVDEIYQLCAKYFLAVKATFPRYSTTLKTNIMQRKLYTTSEVRQFVEAGRVLSLAGDEQVLGQLPKGNWIAGTTPYFMDTKGGLFSRDMIFVEEIHAQENGFRMKEYSADSVSDIVADSYINGFTIIIMPAFQRTHETFALKAPMMNGLLDNPLVGWVAGTSISSSGGPKVYNGQTGTGYFDRAVALHVKLPDHQTARVEMVNIFEQDPQGDEICFLSDSFECDYCLVNGTLKNLAEYIENKNLDTRFPLIADYSGAKINVSFRKVDQVKKAVSFYAPVFDSVAYRFAKPVPDYAERFVNCIPTEKLRIHFSCNCILNYLHGDLWHNRIDGFAGPTTFGEIAYQLLNQTLVYMVVDGQHA